MRRRRRKRPLVRLLLAATAAVVVLGVAGLIAWGPVWNESGRTADLPAVDLPDVDLPGLPRGGGDAPPDAECPPGEPSCVVVGGRVMLVESVDPDGDGDLHVVLAGRSSITGPGVTAVDIRPGLRPEEDPGLGDRMSAAGLVQRGSHGQSQVHALDVNW